MSERQTAVSEPELLAGASEVALQDSPLAVDERTAAILERRHGIPPKHRRGWMIRRLLLGADLFSIAGAFLISERIFDGRAIGSVSIGPELALFGATLPLWGLVSFVYGLYKQDDSRVAHTTIDEVISIFHMVTVCTWGFFAVAWLTGVAHPEVEKLIFFWALATILVPLVRSAVRAYARSTTTFLQNVVIVGAGDVGQTLAEKFLRHPEYGVNLVGFVDAEPKEQRPALEHLAILGSPPDLQSIIHAYDIERVIVAFSRDSAELVLDVLRSLENHWVQIDIVPRYFEIISSGTGLSSVEGMPLYGLAPRALSSSSQIVKRAVDLLLGVFLLIVLAPLFLAIALAISLDDRGAVLFRQPRVGVRGREFSIYKFRTMVRGADEHKQAVAGMNKHAQPGGDARMFKVRADPRVTRVGKILRHFSLDELPQLLNVLRGEMSLVGPRPLIPEEDNHVGLWGRRRLDLKPGMTGLWQTLGRSEIPFEEMVRLDYLYITNWSLWNDLKLLCQTVPHVTGRGKGAY